MRQFVDSTHKSKSLDAVWLQHYPLYRLELLAKMTADIKMTNLERGEDPDDCISKENIRQTLLLNSMISDFTFSSIHILNDSSTPAMESIPSETTLSSDFSSSSNDPSSTPLNSTDLFSVLKHLWKEQQQSFERDPFDIDIDILSTVNEDKMSYPNETLYNVSVWRCKKCEKILFTPLNVIPSKVCILPRQNTVTSNYGDRMKRNTS